MILKQRISLLQLALSPSWARTVPQTNSRAAAILVKKDNASSLQCLPEPRSSVVRNSGAKAGLHSLYGWQRKLSFLGQRGL